MIELKLTEIARYMEEQNAQTLHERQIAFLSYVMKHIHPSNSLILGEGSTSPPPPESPGESADPPQRNAKDNDHEPTE